LPQYPLFQTAYNVPKKSSSDRPESYQQGVWLDIAAVQQRVSMRQKQEIEAQAAATRPDDISAANVEGSLHIERSTVLVETREIEDAGHAQVAAQVASADDMEVDERHNLDEMTLENTMIVEQTSATIVMSGEEMSHSG
jgi:hypothetical protein